MQAVKHWLQSVRGRCTAGTSRAEAHGSCFEAQFGIRNEGIKERKEGRKEVYIQKYIIAFGGFVVEVLLWSL